MENKEIEMGDIVVMLGCEKCDCTRRGRIFEINRIQVGTRWAYSDLCQYSNPSICLEKIATGKNLGQYYPLSWLRTYPHFKEWHGK